MVIEQLQNSGAAIRQIQDSMGFKRSSTELKEGEA
jgi:hypothetical protein